MDAQKGKNPVFIGPGGRRKGGHNPASWTCSIQLMVVRFDLADFTLGSMGWGGKN
jgi:hypothetical protein